MHQQVSLKINNQDKEFSTQSVQNKGLLLARLLQRAVQNKRNSLNTALSKSNQFNQSLVQGKNAIKKRAQIMQTPKQTNQQKQVPLKKSQNSSMLKSKFTAFEEQDFSFDDSMQIQPSFVTNQGDQVGQMLRYIYTQTFGEQKYLTDKKRYKQIQMNSEQYNIDPSQDFNKQGKMLQNVIYQVRSLKLNLQKCSGQIKQLNQELDQMYIKEQKQQKTIIQLEQSYPQSASPCRMIQSQSMPYDQLLTENKVLQMSLEQLEQQHFALQQSMRKVQFQFQSFINKTQGQNLKNQSQLQRLSQLEQLLSLRDKQIDHLLFNVGELQIQLNQIKNLIEIKQNQIRQDQTLLQSTTQKQCNRNSNCTELKMLSTILQQVDSINMTSFKRDSLQVDQVAGNKCYVDGQSPYKDNNRNQQLHRLIIQLKRLLARKQKVIFTYQKQIETHEAQVQKYEAFIAQLSGQIQLCRLKLACHHGKQYQMVNRKVQTDQKYLQFLKNNKQSQLNKKLTFEQRQEQFLLDQNSGEEPSRSDEVGNNERQEQSEDSQNSMEVSFKKVSTHLFAGDNSNQMGQMASKQKHWDEASVTLSQFSQTEELRDIRNLTKQLSQAYDKIISLTYQVNSLKRQSSQR